ncbi:hypothetical protein Dimus_019157 [Dionaea muscipula]
MLLPNAMIFVLLTTKPSALTPNLSLSFLCREQSTRKHKEQTPLFKTTSISKKQTESKPSKLCLSEPDEDLLRSSTSLNPKISTSRLIEAGEIYIYICFYIW